MAERWSYVRTWEHREAARRAQRVLELAVGAALGPAEDEKGGRGKKASHSSESLSKDDVHRFRRLYAHHELVEECLADGTLARKAALRRHQSQPPGGRHARHARKRIVST